MALVVGAVCALCYALLVHRLRRITAERDLKIADQLGALDSAIQALETRLAEYRAIESAAGTEATTGEQEQAEPEGESVSGEIKAVIAAAASAVLRKNAAIKSIRSVPTPWSQQGRVLVQGSHNLRTRQ
ncbi:MAG TPA: hypothetical protein VGI45_19260 [Terracidiphilus sp.]